MKPPLPKVIIVHGWASSPHRGWINWLADELKNRGYEVVAPAMPKPRQPDMADWLKAIQEAAAGSQSLIVVGHSMGTYALLEFIRILSATVKVKQAIFVAGFYVNETDTYWPGHFVTDKDFVQIRRRIKQSTVIYSNDDRVVVPNRSRELAKQLKAEMILELNRRHFSNLKLKTLPIVLEVIEENSRQTS